jgi:hypothetical protein
MAYGIEKRKCRRFKIPGAEGRYQKVGLLGAISGFSKAYSVMNVSKGGLAFLCDKRLGKKKKLIFQLLVPNRNPLNLRARVRRQNQWMGGDLKITGIEFMPFGERKGLNPPDLLDILRELDTKYGKDE